MRQLVSRRVSTFTSPRTTNPFAMHISSILVSSSLALLTSAQSYNLEDDYSISNFANMFNFETEDDPTGGYVNYIDSTTAQESGLFSANGSQVYMGADSTNVATGRGRDSLRLSSKKIYNHGLIILDLEHMPYGCGTWPAFWTLGPNWPSSGEIDIIEGVNSQSTNSLTAHTNGDCSITNTGAMSGTISTSNCDVNDPNQATNAGCSIATSNTESYGPGLNGIGGGVYATEWTSNSISIWFFPRGTIPNDISSGSPDPSNWGLPVAHFAGACDIDEHFQNQQIMFDLTFCGQWAGQVWTTDDTCSSKAATCQEYVQNNPEAFSNAYWLINSLKVYQQNGAAAPSATSATTSATSSYVQTSATTFATVTSSTAPAYTTPAYTTPAYTTPYSSASATASTTAYSVSSTNTWSSQQWTQTWQTQTWSAAAQATATQSWGGWNGGNGNGNGNGWDHNGGGWQQSGPP